MAIITNLLAILGLVVLLFWLFLWLTANTRKAMRDIPEVEPDLQDLIKMVQTLKDLGDILIEGVQDGVTTPPEAWGLLRLTFEKPEQTKALAQKMRRDLEAEIADLEAQIGENDDIEVQKQKLRSEIAAV